MMWYGNGGMGALMVLGGILMLLFWVGIIGLVVWGVATLTKHYSPGSGSPERRDAMLEERSARSNLTRSRETYLDAQGIRSGN